MKNIKRFFSFCLIMYSRFVEQETTQQKNKDLKNEQGCSKVIVSRGKYKERPYILRLLIGIIRLYPTQSPMSAKTGGLLK